MAAVPYEEYLCGVVEPQDNRRASFVGTPARSLAELPPAGNGKRFYYKVMSERGKLEPHVHVCGSDRTRNALAREFARHSVVWYCIPRPHRPTRKRTKPRR